MTIQRVGSKWAKTNALLADPELKKYVPATRAFSKTAIGEMLDRCRMVYVKPVNGTFGIGVIRVEKRPGSGFPYVFQSGVRKYRCRSFETMFGKLAAIKLRKSYLVQQGIELLRYAKRRFDLRIMVQKNPQNEWETTGIIGRLAHPRKIVTNYHSGGTPMPFEKLLKPHVNQAEMESFRKQLEDFGVTVATAMERKFPRLKEIGIDVALDANRKTWILEINTLPDPYIFRRLPDRSVFRKIYRYAAAYGRFRRKTRRLG